MADLSSKKLSELTDAEINAPGSDFLPESHDAPVGELEPTASLQQEYAHEGAQAFAAKLEWLKKEGWNKLRRMKGDGDCFYRGAPSSRSSLDDH
jgi:ubiquitin thioesterase protein OTUB1